ncbi:MAG: hypothetical protein F6J98_22275 [Moorea sp. SIO4G2]|nr:hypothetical protein [Moorena sp. SIO4G2]
MLGRAATRSHRLSSWIYQLGDIRTIALSPSIQSVDDLTLILTTDIPKMRLMTYQVGKSNFGK